MVRESALRRLGQGAAFVCGDADVLFLHPMWSSESERIGKRMCTPAGYALHALAELLGFIGLLTLLASIVYGLSTGRGWPIAATALALGIVSEVMFQFSWWMAKRRGFAYDDSTSEASWLDHGQRRTYRWTKP